MRRILFLMLFLALASSCATKQESKIVYEDIEKPVYIKCEKPVIPKKLQFVPCQIFRVRFEGKYYYCMDTKNAKILSENWLKYKNWCGSLIDTFR